MGDNLCIQDLLRLRYSFQRIQWLIGTISIVSMVYLTSDELWKLVDAQPFPEINSDGFLIYVIFFLVGLIIVHYIDIRKIIRKKSTVLGVILISIVIDLFLISIAELIVLFAIQAIPKNLLDICIVLLIGAFPSSMGSIVLSSLTAEMLKKRSQKLLDEVRELSKQIPKLENQRKESEERLKLFEKKMREFDDSFKKDDI